MKISGTLEKIESFDDIVAFVDDSIKYDLITHSGMANFGTALKYDELIEDALKNIDQIKKETSFFIKKSMGEMDK